jgi:hypothetical protein
MLRIISYCPIEIAFTLAMVAMLLLLSVDGQGEGGR